MDKHSKLSNIHVLLNLIFPHTGIEATAQQDLFDYNTRVLREFVKFYKRKQESLTRRVPLFLTTGSRACCLRQSLMLLYNEAGEPVEMTESDCDLMIIEPEIIVGRSGKFDDGLQFITDGHPTGFGKIHMQKSITNEEVIEQVNGNWFWSAEKFKDFILTEVGLNRGKNKGPSKQGKIQSKIKDLNVWIQFETDRVPAMLCFQRPQFQWNDWHDAMATWPPAERIPALMEGPIFLVPVASPVAENPALEWRLSFSYQEVLLSREITVHQKQIYMAVKFMLKFIAETSDIEGFKTYFCLNSFFWLCEEIPTEEWELNKLKCLLRFCDYMTKCLKARCLRQYMNPENNLLQFAEEDWTSRLADIFGRMQTENDLIEMLLEAQKRFRFFSLKVNLSELWRQHSSLDGTVQVEKLLFAVCKLTALDDKPPPAVRAVWNACIMLTTDSTTMDTQLLHMFNMLQTMLADHVEKYDTLVDYACTMLEGRVLTQTLQQLAATSTADPVPLDDPWLQWTCQGTSFTNYCKTRIDYECGKYIYELPYSDKLTMISKQYQVLINSYETVSGVTPDDIESIVREFPAAVPEQFHDLPLLQHFTRIRDEAFKNEAITYPRWTRRPNQKVTPSE